MGKLLKKDKKDKKGKKDKKADKSDRAGAQAKSDAPKQNFDVLVIDSNKPWQTLFDELLQSGNFKVTVHQATWDNIVVSGYAGRKPVVSLKNQGTVLPDFVLCRQLIDRSLHITCEPTRVRV
jgi:hypothetical protein